MRDALRGGVDVRRTAAITRVDEYVAGISGGGRLSSRDLEQYRKRGIEVGWRLFVVFSNGARHELHLLVETAFPYTAPRVVVVGGPDVLTWPHLEKDGFLCILETEASVSVHRPVDVIREVLDKACRLIEECVAGLNEDDFRKEFLSYWSIAADANGRRVISVIEPRGPGRRVSVWRGREVTVIGEDEGFLRQWLSRWRNFEAPVASIHDGALIWLPVPLVPVEYPGGAADVLALAAERSPETVSVLEELAVSKADSIDIVLGAATSNGTCLGVVRVCPPMIAALEHGFRPGRTPRNLVVRRYYSGATKVTKGVVERADHGWIHGRDRDRRQERLRRCRVAVVGVGSVGGTVARLLAQAGIGDLLLVDPDMMDWPNVGRHELGAASVQRNKAVELASQLGRSFPHVEVSGRADRLGPAATRLVEELASRDLVVSTTGNWAAESFLNDVQRESNGYPAVLYGWVEPHAAAAHAVLVCGGDACLQCGVGDFGRPRLTVTDWAYGQDGLQEPACGAVFAPYGPVELCHVHALVAECAIDALIGVVAAAVHRVWIGNRRHVESAGGAWSPGWLAEVGDPGDGGVTLERPWPAFTGCLVCAPRGRVA